MEIYGGGYEGGMQRGEVGGVFFADRLVRLRIKGKFSINVL